MLPSQIQKRINFNFEKQKLIFDSSTLLFSFAKIDDGTKALLNSLRKNSEIQYNNILDLGCGYGIIGIFLKKSFPNSEVLCADRDSLAVEFAEHNSKLNSVKIKTATSLDFENVTGRFSLIVCNFPAKLEKNGLRYFIEKSSDFLEENGTLALVIVKELDQEMQEILRDDNIITQFKDKTNGYFVYHLKFKNKINSDGFSYYTNSLDIAMENKSFRLETTNALREFDTPHFITELIGEKFANKNLKDCKSITVINPGQGLIPLAATDLKSVNKIILACRDLLQLKVSEENLKLNHFDKVERTNTDFPQNSGDLLIWSLYDEGAAEILEKLVVFKKNFKKIIIGGRIQVINRIIHSLNLETKNEPKKGKYSVIEI
jgi:16S rRNA (guanine1207-N2)-methyltransferase